MNLNTRAIVESSSTSNVLTVMVLDPKINMDKYSSRDTIIVGEIATYTIEIINSGSLDVLDMTLTDTIPAQLQVNSIMVDGSVVAGDLSTGISLGTLPAGSSRIVTIVVEGLDTILNFVNSANLNVEFTSGSIIDVVAEDTDGLSVVEPYLSLIKLPLVTHAKINQIVPYTIQVQNTGNISLSEVILYDVLPIDLEYIKGSLYVNGVKINTQDILTGLKIYDLQPGKEVLVKFDVRVVGNSVNPVQNQANALYKYSTNDLVSPQYQTASSNISNLYVSNVELTLTKDANVSQIRVGENVHYTITIANTGDTILNNVMLRDKLPCLLTFVPQTFTINGVSYNITANNLFKGIPIGTIESGGSVVVEFDANLRGTNCTVNTPARLDNVVMASYVYILPNGDSGVGRTDEVVNSINKIV